MQAQWRISLWLLCSCLGLCILKRDPHSWQVSCETCLTLVEKSRSWIQGPYCSVCLHSWGAGLITALLQKPSVGKSFQLSLGPWWNRAGRLLAREGPFPLLCAEHKQTGPPSQMGMFAAHLNYSSQEGLLWETQKQIEVMRSCYGIKI